MASIMMRRPDCAFFKYASKRGFISPRRSSICSSRRSRLNALTSFLMDLFLKGRSSGLVRGEQDSLSCTSLISTLKSLALGMQSPNLLGEPVLSPLPAPWRPFNFLLFISFPSCSWATFQPFGGKAFQVCNLIKCAYRTQRRCLPQVNGASLADGFSWYQQDCYSFKSDPRL